MNGSNLADITKISPNNSGQRTEKITRITPHCIVGQWSAQKIADHFSKIKTASCNYGIGTEGNIALVVPENMRSWCSSSRDNDQRAITIECASEPKYPYTMNRKVWASLILLCTDICRRNNKTKLVWIPDKEKALSYVPKDNEMLLTVHRWFANKSCPGKWLYDRMGILADIVTSKLNPKMTYRVQVGAYASKANAKKTLEWARRYYPDAFIRYTNDLYKVQIGTFNNYDNAKRTATEAINKGFKAIVTT